jgi:site-specific DNA recombinase
MLKIGYARVSSIEQQDDRGALRKQLERLRNAGCDRCYWDIQSRTTEVREGLQQLVNDLKLATKGKVSELVVIRIDRIGSSSRLFYSLLEILRSQNIKLTALDQAIDTESLGGELTIDILLAAAKFEVKMLSSRVSAERKHRMTQRKSHRFAPLGWVVENDKYIRDERWCVSLLENNRSFRVWELAELVFQVFDESGSVRKTCNNLNRIFGTPHKVETKLHKQSKSHQVSVENLDEVDLSPHGKKTYKRYPWASLQWSPAGLKDFLVNPVHAGGTPFNTTQKQGGKRKHFDQWEVNWDTHEGIITREKHEQIKKVIRSNANNRWAGVEGSYTNPFANLLKCACCGGALTRQAAYKSKDGTPNHWYQCTYYSLGRCKTKQMLSSHLVDLSHESVEEPASVKSLRESLSSLEKLPPIPAIEKAKDDIREEIARVISSGNAIAKHSAIIRDELIQMFSDRVFWDTRTQLDKKRILSRLVRRVVVDGTVVLRVDLL